MNYQPWGYYFLYQSCTPNYYLRESFWLKKMKASIHVRFLFASDFSRFSINPLSSIQVSDVYCILSLFNCEDHPVPSYSYPESLIHASNCSYIHIPERHRIVLKTLYSFQYRESPRFTLDAVQKPVDSSMYDHPVSRHPSAPQGSRSSLPSSPLSTTGSQISLPR